MFLSDTFVQINVSFEKPLKSSFVVEFFVYFPSVLRLWLKVTTLPVPHAKKAGSSTSRSNKATTCATPVLHGH